MTNAQFCDIHPDQATSLIRPNTGTVYTIVLQKQEKQLDKKTQKKVSWTHETKFHGCQKCIMQAILERAKGLGIEPEWDVYRLSKNEDGKFHRIAYDTDGKEE